MPNEVRASLGEETRPPSTGLVASWERIALGVACAVIAVVRIAAAVGSHPSRSFDSEDYLGIGRNDSKPPLAGLLMRVFPSDTSRAIGFALIGSVAAALLLVAVARSSTPRAVRWVVIAVLTIWLTSGYLRVWDVAVLPESLAISFGIAAVAALSLGLTLRSRPWLLTAGAVAAAAAAVREPLIPAALAIVAAACWALLRGVGREHEVVPEQDERRPRALVIVAAFVPALALLLAVVSVIGLGSRVYDVGYVSTTVDGFRTANVTWRRIAVEDPGWLSGRGIRVPADYEAPLVIPTYFDDPANAEAAERDGSALVAKFLLTHPRYAIVAPFVDEEGMAFRPSLFDTYDPNDNVRRTVLDRLLGAPGGALGIALAFVTLGMLAAWPWTKSSSRRVLALVSAAAMGGAMVAWHFDGVESLRHVMPSLSLWIAAIALAIVAGRPDRPDPATPEST